jgi:hypothetical protein
MILPFDELNVVRSGLEELSIEAGSTKENVKPLNKDDCIDLVLDALIVAYVYGVETANQSLGTAIPTLEGEMRSAIEKKIAGKDFRERVSEYAAAGDIASIMRVADTDMTRIFNEAGMNTARAVSSGGRPVTKTWRTMEDDRVRDTHEYLQGMTVPLEARFYTYDGDSAMYPGDFGNADNNCNCRCLLEFR